VTEVVLWRIAADTLDYEADDLSGEGAKTTGGRWNRKGDAMIYASTSIALACLETIVHLSGGNPLPLNRYLVELTIPATLWDAGVDFDPAGQVGWDAEPAGRISVDWGTAWLRSRKSLLARVPSIIVPEEQNVLINPDHPHADRVRSKRIRKWLYDQRLS